MNDVAIRCEGLGKQYRIGERERYKALRDTIADTITAPFRRLTKFRNPQSEIRNSEFWALKDVSFEVKRGEVIGIIGRNGAGKSTLLKILSRITAPTTGEVKIHGRVGSLLEVGTGFHPELTGRENIYLNGAILGMGREEIKRKFDEIVAFAEVEQFIDTPVKRYSSGMYVRLAFSVAAHLESDILLVDEVLAVGDAAFQKKCLGRMGEVAKYGRTVLFVSHDMRKVTTLCSRGILLNSGRIECQGEITEVAATYLEEDVLSEAYADLSRRGDRSGNGEAKLQSIELLRDDQRTNTFEFGEELIQKIIVDVQKPSGASLLAIVITSSDGVAVHELWNVNEGCPWAGYVGTYEFKVTIPRLSLYPGSYNIDIWLGNGHMARVDYITSAITFNVVQTSNSKLERPLDRSNGLVYQSSLWSSRLITAMDNYAHR
jgi:lipopolysaccharide transport system ATP-binding protein